MRKIKDSVLKCTFIIFTLLVMVLFISCLNCVSANKSNDVVDYILDKKEDNALSFINFEDITGIRFYSSWDYEHDVPLQYAYFTTLSLSDIIDCNWLETYYVQQPYEWLNITGYEQLNLEKLAKYFPKLTAVGIEGMEFSSLNGIENLEHLSIIRIDMPSNIRDISNLAEVKSLEYISLYGGRIKDISCINNMPRLLSLEIYSSKVTKLGNLNNLPNLTYINLEDNRLKNAEAIENCYTLKELNLSRNFLRDISFAANLPDLQTLNISNNKISDISCLTSLDNLIYVNCENNPINSFQPIVNI